MKGLAEVQPPEGFVITGTDMKETRFDLNTFRNSKGVVLYQKVYTLQRVNPQINSAEYGEAVNRNYREYKILHDDLSYCHLQTLQHITLSGSNVFATTRQSLHKTLVDRVRSQLPLSDTDDFHLCSQIFLALRYVHQKKLAHCNLTPRNVGLSVAQMAYLTDFGLIAPHFFKAAQGSLDRENDTYLISYFYPECSREIYQAPEQIAAVSTKLNSFANPEEVEQLQKIDVFSLACVLFYILSKGEHLFSMKSLLLYKDLQNKEEIHQHLMAVKDSSVRNLLEKMLKPNPSERVSLDEAFSEWNLIHFPKRNFYYLCTHFLRRPELDQADNQTITCVFFLYASQREKLIDSKMLMKPERFSSELISKYGDLIRERKLLNSVAEIFELISETLPEILGNPGEQGEEEGKEDDLQGIVEEGRNQLEKVLLANFTSLSKQLSPQREDLTLEDCLSTPESKPAMRETLLDYRGARHRFIGKCIDEQLSSRDFSADKFVLSLLKHLSFVFDGCLTFEGFMLTVKCFMEFSRLMGPGESLLYIHASLRRSLEGVNQMQSRGLSLWALVRVEKNLRFFDHGAFTNIRSIENHIRLFLDSALNSGEPELSALLLRNFARPIKTVIRMAVADALASGAPQTPEDLQNDSKFHYDFRRIAFLVAASLKKFSSRSLADSSGMDELIVHLIRALRQTAWLYFDSRDFIELTAVITANNHSAFKFLSLPLVPALQGYTSALDQLKTLSVLAHLDGPTPPPLDAILGCFEAVEVVLANIQTLQPAFASELLIFLQKRTAQPLPRLARIKIQVICQRLLDLIPPAQLPLYAAPLRRLNRDNRIDLRILPSKPGHLRAELIDHRRLIPDVPATLQTERPRPTVAATPSLTVEVGVESSTRVGVGRESLRNLWPSGRLVANLSHSAGPVTHLAASLPELVFAGGSDGRICIFNLAALGPSRAKILEDRVELGSSVTAMLGLGQRPGVIASTRSGEIAIIDERRLLHRWRADSAVAALSSADESSYFVSLGSGESVILDTRTSRLQNLPRLAAGSGTPKTVTSTRKGGEVFLGTTQGLLARFDLRRMCFDTPRFLRGDSGPLPISLIKEFELGNGFLAPGAGPFAGGGNTQLLLTYASSLSEFSVFDAESKGGLPRLHFACDYQQSFDTRVAVPSLEERPSPLKSARSVFPNELCFCPFELQRKMQTRAGLLSLAEPMSSALPWAFSEQIFTSFSDSAKFYTEFRPFEFKSSTRAVALAPSLQLGSSFRGGDLDNIIITGGEDRCLRFMNFGNCFPMQDQMRSTASALPFFHLTNPDFCPRKFYYFFSGPELLVIREGTGNFSLKQQARKDYAQVFGINSTLPENGLSKFMEKLAEPKTDNQLPRFPNTHSKAINDVLLVEASAPTLQTQNQNNKALYVVSCGDDGVVNIWN